MFHPAFVVRGDTFVDYHLLCLAEVSRLLAVSGVGCVMQAVSGDKTTTTTSLASGVRQVESETYFTSRIFGLPCWSNTFLLYVFVRAGYFIGCVLSLFALCFLYLFQS